MISYLKGYEIKLSDDVITNMTAMFQKRNKTHVLTVLYDDFGREIARDTDKRETEIDALLGVLWRAYTKREADYIQSQKAVYTALKEPLPSEEFLRGEFTSTADAKEILTLAKGVKNDNQRKTVTEIPGD